MYFVVPNKTRIGKSKSENHEVLRKTKEGGGLNHFQSPEAIDVSKMLSGPTNGVVGAGGNGKTGRKSIHTLTDEILKKANGKVTDIKAQAKTSLQNKISAPAATFNQQQQQQQQSVTGGSQTVQKSPTDTTLVGKLFRNRLPSAGKTSTAAAAVNKENANNSSSLANKGTTTSPLSGAQISSVPNSSSVATSSKAKPLKDTSNPNTSGGPAATAATAVAASGAAGALRTLKVSKAEDTPHVNTPPTKVTPEAILQLLKRKEKTLNHKPSTQAGAPLTSGPRTVTIKPFIKDDVAPPVSNPKIKVKHPIQQSTIAYDFKNITNSNFRQELIKKFLKLPPQDPSTIKRNPNPSPKEKDSDVEDPPAKTIKTKGAKPKQQRISRIVSLNQMPKTPSPSTTSLDRQTKSENNCDVVVTESEKKLKNKVACYSLKRKHAYMDLAACSSQATEISSRTDKSSMTSESKQKLSKDQVTFASSVTSLMNREYSETDLKANQQSLSQADLRLKSLPANPFTSASCLTSATKSSSKKNSKVRAKPTIPPNYNFYCFQNDILTNIEKLYNRTNLTEETLQKVLTENASLKEDLKFVKGQLKDTNEMVLDIFTKLKDSIEMKNSVTLLESSRSKSKVKTQNQNRNQKLNRLNEDEDAIPSCSQDHARSVSLKGNGECCGPVDEADEDSAKASGSLAYLILTDRDGKTRLQAEDDEEENPLVSDLEFIENIFNCKANEKNLKDFVLSEVEVDGDDGDGDDNGDGDGEGEPRADSGIGSKNENSLLKNGKFSFEDVDGDDDIENIDNIEIDLPEFSSSNESFTENTLQFDSEDDERIRILSAQILKHYQDSFNLKQQQGVDIKQQLKNLADNFLDTDDATLRLSDSSSLQIDLGDLEDLKMQEEKSENFYEIRFENEGQLKRHIIFECEPKCKISQEAIKPDAP